MNRKWMVLPVLCGALVLIGGCQQREQASQSRQAESAARAPLPAFNEAAAEAFSVAVWQSGQAQVVDARAAVEALNRAVTTLLERPSEDHLEAARLAWLDAHRQFAAAQPYIHIAFEPAPLRSQGRALLLALDSWPVQAGYLDTVPGYSDSGIVNDTTIELTLANLRKQHRLTAHEEASTGFHAMEIMLWGPTGQRSADQFKAVTDGEKPAALAANRRRELTRLIGLGMAEDMAGLASRWPAGANDLSRHFLALAPASRLRQIRAAHTRALDESLLRRLPESSESDVESGRAADSKQVLLAMLGTLEANWVPAEGKGLAELMLDRHQVKALAQTFDQLEELLLKMVDPIELAELSQLAKARLLLERLAGLMSGTAQVPAAKEDMTPVSLEVEEG